MNIPSGRLAFAELPSETILSRAEVAEGLGIRPREVERLGIPCFAPGHKTRLYRKSEVLTWLEACRHEPRK